MLSSRRLRQFLTVADRGSLRAAAATGQARPFAVAGNPRGYLNNAMHRIALTAAA